MVREARFSQDDAEGFELPPARDTFDDLDDLCDLDPPRLAPAARRRKAVRRPRLPQADRPDPCRHLAGADWLNDLSGSR